MAPQTSGFERVSGVLARGEGRYECELDPGWTTLAGINGGMLMAIIINALHAEVGDGRQVRSLTTHFMRPPAAGAATVIVEVLRGGGRASNARVRLEQNGRLCLEALAVLFVGELDEIAQWGPAMPQVGPPRDRLANAGDSPDPRRPALADHITYTPRIGPRPFSGTAPVNGEATFTGGWLELRDPAPITPGLLALYLDAWWPPSLGPLTEMALNPTIDLTLHVRSRLPDRGLPPQPLLLEATTIAAGEGFCEEDARLFTADGVLLAQARQLAIMLTPQQRKMVTKDAPLSAN